MKKETVERKEFRVLGRMMAQKLTDEELRQAGAGAKGPVSTSVVWPDLLDCTP